MPVMVAIIVCGGGVDDNVEVKKLMADVDSVSVPPLPPPPGFPSLLAPAQDASNRQTSTAAPRATIESTRIISPSLKIVLFRPVLDYAIAEC
jgi:hypothetical protein